MRKCNTFKKTTCNRRRKTKESNKKKLEVFRQSLNQKQLVLSPIFHFLHPVDRKECTAIASRVSLICSMADISHVLQATIRFDCEYLVGIKSETFGFNK